MVRLRGRERALRRRRHRLRHLPGRVDAVAVADYLYLIAYPLFAALPVMLIVRSGIHRRIGALTDAAIVTLAFVVFEWIFVMQPNLHARRPARTTARAQASSTRSWTSS